MRGKTCVTKCKKTNILFASAIITLPSNLIIKVSELNIERLTQRLWAVLTDEAAKKIESDNVLSTKKNYYEKTC